MFHKESLVRKRLKDDFTLLEGKGYNVLGVFLQGSQNYELDYEGSDIDTKAIVVPSFEDIIHNKKPKSTTLVLPSNEHVDIKDVRLMFQCFKKQNINFLEILFTKYYFLNPEYEKAWLELVEHKEEIARYNNYASINCMAGMIYEKFKALKHPYPATKDKIEKWGYDPKQLHHIIRVTEFMERFFNGESFEDCLVSGDKEYLLAVKQGYHSLDFAELLADCHNKKAKSFKDKYMNENENVKNEKAEQALYNCLTKVMEISLAKRFASN